MRIRARWNLAILSWVATACGTVSPTGVDPDARVDPEDPDARVEPADLDAGGGDEYDAAVAALCPEGMAFIPGGSFELAEVPDEVNVEAFCMDITHVTAGAYAECESCSPAATTAECNTDVVNRASDPANCVDVAQARFYCESVDKYLPSEEQWEWAGRGGEAANLYAWGDDPPIAGDDRLCWFSGRDDQAFPERPSATCPVGFYDQGDVHPFGLEDMTGNVWTWTTTVDGKGHNRVVRGGGWDNIMPDRMTTGFRNTPIPASTRNRALGFRCAQAPL